MVSQRTTGAKVSTKSTPSVSLKPLATRRALNLVGSPLILVLSLKTHCEVMAFLSRGSGTIDHGRLL